MDIKVTTDATGQKLPLWVWKQLTLHQLKIEKYNVLFHQLISLLQCLFILIASNILLNSVTINENMYYSSCLLSMFWKPCKDLSYIYARYMNVGWEKNAKRHLKYFEIFLLQIEKYSCTTYLEFSKHAYADEKHRTIHGNIYMYIPLRGRCTYVGILVCNIGPYNAS